MKNNFTLEELEKIIKARIFEIETEPCDSKELKDINFAIVDELESLLLDLKRRDDVWEEKEDMLLDKRK